MRSAIEGFTMRSIKHIQIHRQLKKVFYMTILRNNYYELVFSPEPDLEWKGPKNNLPIRRNTMGPYNSRLTIHKVQPSDEGEYICTGRNRIGNNEKSMQIRVEGWSIAINW